MKGAAERPADPDATADQRPGREPEGATFASTRVPGRRGLPPVLVLGFLAVLAGIVIAALGGRTGGGSAVIPSLAPASPADLAVGATVPDGLPMVTSGPGPIQLQANRESASMFVHGDVFVERVTWVFVSLQDDAGRVAGWASVSVPGAAGPAASSGPSLRFDVDLAVPASVSGTMSVVANAYDTSGALIASTRLEVSADAASASAEPSVVADSAFVDLRVDATGGPAGTTRRVVRVDGQLVARAVSLTIQLETGDAVVDEVTRDMSNQDGGVRPTSSARFEAEFDLTALGVSGPVWVTLAAYDEDGTVVARVRRAVPVG